jgi:hypothetical protein
MLIDFGSGLRQQFTATVNQKVTYGLAYGLATLTAWRHLRLGDLRLGDDSPGTPKNASYSYGMMSTQIVG